MIGGSQKRTEVSILSQKYCMSSLIFHGSFPYSLQKKKLQDRWAGLL